MPAQTTNLLVPNFVGPVIGKMVRALARRHGSGGSAFPGKVVDIIDPQFLTRCLAQLPLGVVLVSGTNGKTTTTRIITSILRDMGLKVFTNPTGSNFVRGVVSALIEQVSVGGRLDADIAVLELDEAYAVHFVRRVKPRYALLLNVMRDQLDRFGEIDTTAKLLSSVAMSTTGTLVLNREDARIAALAKYRLPDARVKYYGLDPSLRHYFPTDDEMYAAQTAAAREAGTQTTVGTSSSPSSHKADVVLSSFDSHHAEFVIGGEERVGADLQLEGVYNLFNAAGALAIVRSVVADAQMTQLRGDRRGVIEPVLPAKQVEEYDKKIIASLEKVTPAFGRGETIDYHGVPIELVLVKNPAGFRLALSSFDPVGASTMIAINDEYADGRDMSWLWDVDFSSLRQEGVAMVSGVRCWDMALRLGYDQIHVDAVEQDLTKAVDRFLPQQAGAPSQPSQPPESQQVSQESQGSPNPKRIYCTYTAMLALRSHLATLTDVSDSGLR
jgi:UDP-N-acetylmuramyl tripeptide synthase